MWPYLSQATTGVTEADTSTSANNGEASRFVLMILTPPWRYYPIGHCAANAALRHLDSENRQPTHRIRTRSSARRLCPYRATVGFGIRCKATGRAPPRGGVEELRADVSSCGASMAKHKPAERTIYAGAALRRHRHAHAHVH